MHLGQHRQGHVGPRQARRRQAVRRQLLQVQRRVDARVQLDGVAAAPGRVDGGGERLGLGPDMSLACRLARRQVLHRQRRRRRPRRQRQRRQGRAPRPRAQPVRAGAHHAQRRRPAVAAVRVARVRVQAGQAQLAAAVRRQRRVGELGEARAVDGHARPPPASRPSCAGAGSCAALSSRTETPPGPRARPTAASRRTALWATGRPYST